MQEIFMPDCVLRIDDREVACQNVTIDAQFKNVDRYPDLIVPNRINEWVMTDLTAVGKIIEPSISGTMLVKYADKVEFLNWVNRLRVYMKREYNLKRNRKPAVPLRLQDYLTAKELYKQVRILVTHRRLANVIHIVTWKKKKVRWVTYHTILVNEAGQRVELTEVL